MYRIIRYGFIMFCIVHISHAIVIKIPQDYPTIQQGINAASANDIVLVAPGTYNEEIDLKADVTVMGAGADQCVINGGGNSGDVVFASGNDITNNTKFTGFYVTGAISGGSMPGGGGIFCNSGAKPDISNNFVEGNDFGIVTWNQSIAYIHNNVVVNNNFGGITLNTNATVINNTISNCRIGINDGGGYGPTVMNNIITDNSLYGVYAVGTQPVLTYNDVWNNATNYHNCSPGTGSISQDPQYVDPPNDYHLQSGSPCIDAGNPAAQYNDPDGSRNDMGAYGGPGAPADFPVVVLTIPTPNEQSVDDTTSAAAMFNMDMDPATFSWHTSQLHGTFTGFRSSAISYDTTTRFITIDPDSTYHCGEIVTGVLSRGVESLTGDSLAGFIWQFASEVDSGSGLFSQSSQYITGSGPLDGVTGDFYRDNNLDIAFVNGASDEVSVFIGNGNGTFVSAVNYTTGTTPAGICAGNFNLNSDPWLDFAVSNESSNSVTIFISNGDGTFTTGNSYSTGNAPQGMCSGDFDRDGLFDLAVVNRNSSTVSILYGNGDGTFSSPSAHTVGGSPLRIICRDFNCDGYLDIATANSTTNNVSILIGNGGGFGGANNYTVGTNPRGVCAADCNNDGNLDIITANFNSDNVTRLLGNGDGTFGSPANFNTGDGPSRINTTDYDADGNYDLAVTNENANTVSILLGTGTGSFNTAVHFNTGSGPSCLVSADFDNDRDMDIVTGDYDADSISVLLNGAALNVVLTDPVQNQLDVNQATDIQATFSLDLDPTTLNDSTFLAYGSQSGMHQGSVTYQSGSLTAMLDPDMDLYDGEIITAILTREVQSVLGPLLGGYAWHFTAEVTAISDGVFADPQDFSVGAQPRGMYAADFDMDGDVDIAATSNPNRVAVLLNNGNGTFGSPAYTTVQGDPIALFGADLDNDQDIDLVSAHNQPGSSHLVILKNNGSGVFTVHATYAPAILGQSVFGGDIDADGDIDLIMGDGWGAGDNVRVMTNNGTGSFSGPVTYTAGTWARGVTIKDVDNDGDLDCAVTNSGNDNVSILYNNGNGDFTQLSNFAIGDNPTAVFGNDLNGDGFVDLAAANYSGNNITVILNNGNGTFGGQTGYATGSNTRALCGSDFDGDGDIDLCGSNNGASSVAVLLNNGDGTYQTAAVYTVGSTPWGIQSADYDQDGDVDIGCNNYNDGDLTILYNTGGGYVEEHDAASVKPFLMVYPNPASDRIVFRFSMPVNDCDLSIKIFDVAGRIVRCYHIPDQAIDPGTIIWDRIDNNGQNVANGVYFCRLESKNTSLTREIILIK